jgi:hypothetical protein
VVAVTPEVARALRLGEPSGHAASILAAATAAGAELAPQHSGVDDPALARWFTASGLDADAAAALAAELRALDGVEAAYVKPGERSAVRADGG